MAYGLTRLASRQLRWTTTLPLTSIPIRIPDSMRKPLLNNIPTINRANADRLLPAKDAYTIHSNEFRGLATIKAFRNLRAAAIITPYRHLSVVEHKQQNSTVTSIDQLSQP